MVVFQSCDHVPLSFPLENTCHNQIQKELLALKPNRFHNLSSSFPSSSFPKHHQTSIFPHQYSFFASCRSFSGLHNTHTILTHITKSFNRLSLFSFSRWLQLQSTKSAKTFWQGETPNTPIFEVQQVCPR